MGEKNGWVDFRAIKEAVTLRMVLDDHYRLTSWQVGKGDELRGVCPLPGCNGKRSFSWNPVKNTFQCFDCKARGNVLDFVAKKEDCSIKEAALKLKEWFKVGESEKPTPGALLCAGGIRLLVSELEGHASQIAYHSSQFNAKLAALKHLVAVDDGG